MSKYKKSMEMLKKIDKRYIIKTAFWFFIFAVLILTFFSFKNNKMARADEEDTMSGWLWSGSAGWISLNSTNCDNLNLEDPGTCGAYGVDYGVTINEGDGNVSGEAWSERFGWLCFGSTCGDWSAGNDPELGNPPAADFDGVKFSGWANIFALGDEGWIKLQGPSISAEGKSGASCFDCYYDDEPKCKSCFTEISPPADNYGLVGDVCYNCSGCVTSTDPLLPDICAQCSECNRYGMVVDSEEKQIYGWAWGGNNGKGIGWIKPYEKNALYSPFSWLQTKYGNIYSEDLVSGRSAPPGRFNATYCIQATGTITNFRSQTGCELIGSEKISFPKQSNLYTNILGKIDKDGIINGKYGDVIIISSPSKTEFKRADLISKLSGSCELGGKVYYVKGNLTIDNTDLDFCNGDDGSGLIIIDGNLTINKNLSYEEAAVSGIKKLASVGWIIKGNLNISQEVNNVVGAFYVEGNDGVDENAAVDTIYDSDGAPGSTDAKLIIYGMVMATKYKFGRTYKSINEGSEQIIYDGRALINTPPGMKDLTKSLPLWSEAAP
ncbi:MAG: hypothetical protein V1860_02425 [bacterium]